MSVRQAAGAQMRQFGTEKPPPPVVAFLLSHCKLAPKEALVGCLRELAAEGLVRLATDTDGTPVVRLGADSPRSGRELLPFEEVALARVRTRARRLTSVPLSALLADDGDGYRDWARRQADELGLAAAQAGLAVKSPPRGIWRGIFALIAVIACTVIVIHGHDRQLGDHLTGPAVLAAALSLVVPFCLRRWRLTAAGNAAVSAWRRDGRGGPGPVPGLRAGGGPTVWDVDRPGTAPPPRGYAWSSLGGQWHTVRLGRVLPPPYWSAPPGLRLLLFYTAMASFWSVMIGLFADDFDFEGKLIAMTPAALAAFVIVTCWLPAVGRRLRLPDTVTFTGEVVKQKFVDGVDDPDRYFVWVDDGSPTTMMFDLAPGNHQRVVTGDLVQVGWSPRRRLLLEIRAVPA